MSSTSLDQVGAITPERLEEFRHKATMAKRIKKAKATAKEKEPQSEEQWAAARAQRQPNHLLGHVPKLQMVAAARNGRKTSPANSQAGNSGLRLQKLQKPAAHRANP